MKKNSEQPEWRLIKEIRRESVRGGAQNIVPTKFQVMLLALGLYFENHRLRERAREKSGRQAGRQTDGIGDRETQMHAAPIHTHSEPERDLERETGPER